MATKGVVYKKKCIKVWTWQPCVCLFDTSLKNSIIYTKRLEYNGIVAFLCLLALRIFLAGVYCKQYCKKDSFR